MNQLKQIKFTKKEKISLLIPKLETEIRRSEKKLKKQKDWIIRAASIISYFSLRFGCDLSYGMYPIEPKQLLMTDIPASIFLVFFCSISGFLIDVINIKYTWFFLTITNIIFQITQLVYAIYDIKIKNVVGMLQFTCLLPIYTINFTCVLYDAASNFRERLNNAVRLEVYGVKSSIVLMLIFRYIIEDHLNISEIKRQQIYNKVEIYGFTFCLLINIMSLLTLQKTYNQIENIKIKSIKYSNFLISQGFRFSFKGIIKQIKKRDVIFLLILSSQCGIQIGSVTMALQFSISKLQQICIYSVGMMTGLVILKLINKNKRLVTACYNAKSYSLYLFLAVSVFQLILIFEQKSKVLPEYIYNVGSTLSFILSSISWLVLYCLIHQALIILLPKRCAIRAIMLSITFFIYFIFEFIVALFAGSELSLRILQIFITFVVIIIDYRYQNNTRFDLIEYKLKKQYNLS